MKTGASSKVRPDGPKSGRAESNSTRHAPPPTSTKPGRNEFRAGETPGTRPAPPPIPKRPNGFAPGSFVGDEPAAANTSAYNTSGFKDRTAPPLPPKTAPYPPQFGKEPRVRTPYSGSGGEKTDPFDGANLSRSNSMRDGSQRVSSLGKPSNTQSLTSSRAALVEVIDPPARVQPEAHITRSHALMLITLALRQNEHAHMQISLHLLVEDHLPALITAQSTTVSHTATGHLTHRLTLLVKTTLTMTG